MINYTAFQSLIPPEISIPLCCAGHVLYQLQGQPYGRAQRVACDFLNFEREKRHAKFVGMEVCNADGTSYVCERWMVLLHMCVSGMVLLTYVCQ